MTGVATRVASTRVGRRPLTARLLVGCLLAAAGLAGCDDDGGGGFFGGADASAQAAAAKGEPCATREDCADPLALCRQGGLCTGPIDALAFQTECASGGSSACAGLMCVGLRDNEQAKTGICSMPCAADADCGSDAACAPLSGRRVCLRRCEADADCVNGYVCVAPPGGGDRGCFVVPTDG